MEQKKMYASCACGSGKKHKFCCHLKRSEQTGARCLAQIWLKANNDSENDTVFSGLEASRLANPFGLVNLAIFHDVRGEEEEAQRLLAEAIEMEPPIEDACVKVCEGIARFKRHQEVLDYVDKAGFSDSPNVCFYAGLAAANLGDKERAQRDLKKVGFRHLKSRTRVPWWLGYWRRSCIMRAKRIPTRLGSASRTLTKSPLSTRA